MAKNKTKIRNPNTGEFVFGYIPEIKSNQIVSGSIFLLNGFHNKKDVGFGLQHIWQKHKDEIYDLGYKSIKDVPRYVLDIIQPDAQIYSEGGNYKNPKITLLKSPLGICVLEEKYDLKTYESSYTVTTAYPVRHAHGRFLGNLGYDCLAVAKKEGDEKSK